VTVLRAARRLLAAVAPSGRRRALAREDRLAEIEAERRAAHSMPAGHPERLTARIGRAGERRLTALQQVLWPRGEPDYCDNRDLAGGDP